MLHIWNDGMVEYWNAGRSARLPFLLVCQVNGYIASPFFHFL
jgi:hypothetical protein